MGREDWVYPNIEKELDDSINEKLKNDKNLKKLGIRKSNQFYIYCAREYLKGKLVIDLED